MQSARAGEREPVAVVSMGCRFPGGVTTPEELWELLSAGREAISGFPEDRGWDLDRLRSSDPGLPGVSTPHEGGFLDDVSSFDAGLFGISPREALAMDPQQRLLLETSWETLERAGIAPASLHGQRVGVFTGTAGQDYLSLLHGAQDQAAGHTLTGAAGSVLSGRVAYALGLRGPALTVDTASSASLVAVHLACRALREGDCSLALAGGATVMATPAMFVEYSKLGGLAPDGRAKPFSARADGTAWAEGVGVLALERLSDARANGRPVLAVIRGSAINQDGASHGLTAPNGAAQQAVIRDALSDAGVEPGDIDAVEAHGTGTPLGDPVEARALLAVYGPDRAAGYPLWLGSLKSNMGHAQAAAGVAGTIKMVMALRHGTLPKTLHLEEPTPRVDWADSGVALLSEERPWPDAERPRRAGVSSYGISGTNVHMILEDAAPEESQGLQFPDRAADDGGRAVAWTLSARGAQALWGQAEQLLSWARARARADDGVPQAAPPHPAAVGRALARERAALEHRAVIVAGDGSPSELLTGLGALSRGEPHADVITGTAHEAARLGVLFTGQGAQRLGMGGELRAHHRVFAEHLDAVCAQLDRALAGHVPEPVIDVVLGRRPDGAELPEAGELLGRTVYAQAGLFAVETALFRLVESWGVRPACVGGHSIGEVVAAHVAGVLSLEDAARFVAARGRLMQALPEGGAMAAVEASEQEVLAQLGAEESAGIAAVNTPQSVVLSGDEDTVMELVGAWQEKGRKTKQLRVSHAFHSPRMDPMLAAFREELESLTFRALRIPVISNLTGRLASAREMTAPEYWVRHVRQAVRFSDGVRAMAQEGVSAFLELGPEGVLSGLGPEALAGDEGASADRPEPLFVPALRPDRTEQTALLAGLGVLWTHGVPLDWAATAGDGGARPTDLPTYAFERRRYWMTPGATGAADVTEAGLAPAEHPLLGAVVELPGTDSVLLTGRLTAREQLCPAGLLLELAVRAADEAGCGRIEELDLTAPLTASVPDGTGTAVRVLVEAPGPEGRRRLAVHSRPQDALPGEPWTTHATGMAAPSGTPPDGPGPGAWPPKEATEETVPDEAVTATGPRTLWRRGGETWAELVLVGELRADASACGMHPALLEGVLDVVRLALGRMPADGPGPATRDPAPGNPALRDLVLHATGAVTLRVRVAPGADGQVRLDAADAEGAPVLSARHVVFPDAQDAESAESADAGGTDGTATGQPGTSYRPAWDATPLPALPPDRGSCALVGADDIGLRSALMAAGTYSDAYRDLAALADAVSGSGRAPDTVVLLGRSLGDASGAAPGDVVACAEETCRTVRQLRDHERLRASRPVFVTRGAVAAREGEGIPGLVDAAAWAALRSLQAEQPGVLTLLDIDDRAASLRAVAAALLSEAPQLALRKGALRLPRLVPVAPGRRAPRLAPEGQTLVTGGDGLLGADVARALVLRHGVRRLHLTTGVTGATGATGASEPAGGRSTDTRALEAELSSYGAQVTVTGCDPADPSQLAALLEALPAVHPLTAVVHTPAPTGAGGIEAAWNLHRHTRELDLTAFVLVSDAGGTLGDPERVEDAAHAAVLDALAHQRTAAGLTATSVACAPEATTSRGDLAGFAPAGAPDAQWLVETGLAGGAPVLLPARTSASALRRGARRGTLHPLLRPIVRLPERRAAVERSSPAPAEGLRGRLADLPDDERAVVLRALVRTSVAAVLSYGSPDEVDTARTLRDLGLESLSAVEFRNRLNEATGLRLPTTVVRSWTTVDLLVRHLDEQLR